MLGRLEGLVCIVTGGGAGLGRAIVKSFVDEGAKVGVLEISGDHLQSLQQELGDNIVTVQGDVTNYQDNRLIVEETVKAFGKVDVFTGNAAIHDHSSKINDVSAEDLRAGFNELFAVNVLGYMLGAKAVLPELKKTKGRMIFSASHSSFQPGDGLLYVASKHAVAGIIRELASQLAPDIRVNGVAPGIIATTMEGLRALDQGEVNVKERVDVSKVPLREVPVPEDYTSLYVLLASPTESRAMTGSILIADSGFTSVGFR